MGRLLKQTIESVASLSIQSDDNIAMTAPRRTMSLQPFSLSTTLDRTKEGNKTRKYVVVDRSVGKEPENM